MWFLKIGGFWPATRSRRLNIADHPFNIGFKESLSGTPYLYKSRGKSSNNMIYLPMNKIMASLHYLVFCCYSSWLMKKNYFCPSRVQCNNMIFGLSDYLFLIFKESPLLKFWEFFFKAKMIKGRNIQKILFICDKIEWSYLCKIGNHETFKANTYCIHS